MFEIIYFRFGCFFDKIIVNAVDTTVTVKLYKPRLVLPLSLREYKENYV